MLWRIDKEKKELKSESGKIESLFIMSFCHCENDAVKMVVSRLNLDSSIQKKNLNIGYLEQEKKLIFKKIDLLGNFYRVNLIFAYFRCIRILSKTLNISYSSLVDEILK